MADPYYYGDAKKPAAGQPGNAEAGPQQAPSPQDTLVKTALSAEQQLQAGKQREQAALKQMLDSLMRQCDGATGAIIVTDDGFPIADHLPRNMDTNRLSAITSSMLGLSESMAREGQHGVCDNVILENGDGNVVMMRIDRLRILTVLAAKSTRLGMLSNSRPACGRAGEAGSGGRAKMIGQARASPVRGDLKTLGIRLPLK